MILRIFFRTIFFLLLAVFQMSFISGLPYGLRELNVLIIFMVLFLEVDAGHGAVWWMFLVGLVFGLYNSFFFPVFILFWPLVFLFCRFLYSNLLTNRSLYSFFGLAVFTTWFYHLFFRSAVYLIDVFLGVETGFFLFDGDFWLSLLWATVLNAAGVFISFSLINQISNRLKPVFIFRKK